MITEKELRTKLKAAIKKSKNISRWARENDLWSQRANISEMMRGKRKISEAVTDKLDYVKREGWVKKNDN